MPKYTTGEIARLSGVSVRTVQYYDDRGILVPSELSEGGRRLYTEDDLKRMHVICFLRDVGLPINSIAVLLKEERPGSIIMTMLEQQESVLREELFERQKKLDLLDAIKRELHDIDICSFDSIGDIAYSVKEKTKLRNMRLIMILTGLPVSALQWSSVIYWILSGEWWLFGVWVAVAVIWGAVVSLYYFGHVAYICPECHKVFRPKLRDAFFEYHTPKMRRLHCPECNYYGLCIEVYSAEEEEI